MLFVHPFPSFTAHTSYTLFPTFTCQCQWKSEVFANDHLSWRRRSSTLENVSGGRSPAHGSSRRRSRCMTMGPVHGSSSFLEKVAYIRDTLAKSDRTAASGLQVHGVVRQSVVKHATHVAVTTAFRECFNVSSSVGRMPQTQILRLGGWKVYIN